MINLQHLICRFLNQCNQVSTNRILEGQCNLTIRCFWTFSSSAFSNFFVLLPLHPMLRLLRSPHRCSRSWSRASCVSVLAGMNRLRKAYANMEEGSSWWPEGGERHRGHGEGWWLRCSWRSAQSDRRWSRNISTGAYPSRKTPKRQRSPRSLPGRPKTRTTRFDRPLELRWQDRRLRSLGTKQSTSASTRRSTWGIEPPRATTGSHVFSAEAGGRDWKQQHRAQLRSWRRLQGPAIQLSCHLQGADQTSRHTVFWWSRWQMPKQRLRQLWQEPQLWRQEDDLPRDWMDWIRCNDPRHHQWDLHANHWGQQRSRFSRWPTRQTPTNSTCQNSPRKRLPRWMPRPTWR